MTNFKQKILKTLKNKKNPNETIKYLSTIQDSLMKNYSNPVFKENDKNKLLDKYKDFEQIGKSLYRYNTFEQNKMLTEAGDESENVSNLVLKGGISSYKYVWHSENSENTCDDCAELDGTEYDFEDEVPERPHPNCQCYVEIVEDYDENTEEDEEECDCVEQVLEWMNECDEACGDIESLINETEYSQNEIENYIDYISSYTNPNIVGLQDELSDLINDALYELYDAIEQIISTIQIFDSNLDDLKTTTRELHGYLDGSAEYFHTKANCEAAQLGDVGEKTATILGYVRELWDFPKEIFTKGQSIKDAFEHGVYDLEINEQGRKLGRENPNANPEDIIKRPEGLPERF